MPSFADLPVEAIVVPADRLRVLSEAKVAALMGLIDDGVFVGRITVRRAGKANTLIDGAHRLEAMRRLGRATIPVDVLECSLREARALEISGNLTAGMTPLQDAIFLAAWQKHYEAEHPEAAAGMAGALAKHGQRDSVQRANMRVAGFAALVAEARKITPQQVRKITAAARALSREEATVLQGATVKLPMADVMGLQKIVDPDERAHVIEALADGKKLAAARRAWATRNGPVEGPAEPAPKPDLKALLSAWDRASLEARLAFLAARGDDLADLGEGGDA